MVFRPRKTTFIGLLGATTALTGVCGFAVAQAAPQPAGESAQHIEDTALPPFAVEDFGYPGADKILQEKGLKLVKGDGHIILADCKDSPDLEVMADKKQKWRNYCFKVTGKNGYLTLEVPELIGIWENEGHTASAKVTSEGKTQTVDLKKNDLTELGKATCTGAKAATLIELRVKG